MGRCFRRGTIEDLAHLGRLVFGPFANRRTTSDGGVLLLDFGRAATGDERAKVGLHAAKGNEVRISLLDNVSVYLVWSSSVSTNNLLRNPPTSSVVEGPPMFMKTMAVGPFEEVASWVTGGTTVAIARDEFRVFHLRDKLGRVAVAAANLAREDDDPYFEA